MKYIIVLLLSVFLIPFVQNVDAQSVLGPTSGGLGGGIKNIPSGGGQTANDTSGQSAQNTTGQAGQSAQNTTGQAGQSMNSTSQQAGQSPSNATSQNNNSTSGGNPIMDMLGKIIPGQ